MNQTAPNYPTEDELKRQWRSSERERIAREEQGKSAGKRIAIAFLVLVPSLFASVYATQLLFASPIEGTAYTAPITALTGLSATTLYLICLILIGLCASAPTLWLLGRTDRAAIARIAARFEAEGLAE